MIVESPLDRLGLDISMHNYWNSCWEAISTMTTVGYGDTFPRTPMGRIIGVVCSIFGVIAVSFILVVTNNTLNLTGPQASAHTVIRRLEVRERLKGLAVQILISINRKHSKDLESEFQRYSKIKVLIDNFRGLRRVYKNIGELNLFDDMNRNFASVYGH
jgi:hypothetical protein